MAVHTDFSEEESPPSPPLHSSLDVPVTQQQQQQEQEQEGEQEVEVGNTYHDTMEPPSVEETQQQQQDIDLVNSHENKQDNQIEEIPIQTQTLNDNTDSDPKHGPQHASLARLTDPGSTSRPSSTTSTTAPAPPSLCIRVPVYTDSTTEPTSTKLVHVLVPSFHPHHEGLSTTEEFGTCLWEVLAAASRRLDLRAPVSGLYREQDHMFLPLSYILHHAQDLATPQHIYYCASLVPHPPPPPPPSSSPQTLWHYFLQHLQEQPKWIQCSLATAILSMLLPLMRFVVKRCIKVVLLVMRIDQEAWLQSLWEYGMDGLASLYALVEYGGWMVRDVFVDTPIRQLYRYGPSFLGWEGASLPKICSLLSHAGDETFWTQNLHECQRMYHTKERAVLYLGRPLCVFMVGYVVWGMVKAWFKARAVRPVDPNMVETYEAFQGLVRQWRRNMVVGQ